MLEYAGGKPEVSPVSVELGEGCESGVEAVGRGGVER